MCNLSTNVQNIVSDVLDNLIKENELFTAYDVTKLVRSQTTEQVDHSEVQQLVHNAFSDGDFGVSYTRTFHTFYVGGNATRAYVYHDVVLNVNNYDPNELHVGSASQVSVPVVPVVKSGFIPTPIVAAVAAQQTAGITVNTDKNGRVCLSNKLVKAAGFKPGDDAYVHVSSVQNLLVVAPIQWHHTLLGVLKVDKDSNIRLTPSMLRKAGYSGTTFSVRGTDTHLTIE